VGFRKGGLAFSRGAGRDRVWPARAAGQEHVCWAEARYHDPIDVYVRRADTVVETLPADVIARLDASIVAGHIIEGIQVVHGCLATRGLGDALEVFTARYARLRDTRPDAFQSSHDEYWKGFDS